MSNQSLRSSIIIWNNRFPLDRQYRKKYNIPYGSQQHRETNPVDIYFDWLEDQVFEEFIEDAKEQIKNEKEFEKGIWLKEEQLSDEQSWDAFDKLDVGKINDNSNLKIE